MRIVVFGAAGGTGRQIVQQALGHGHHVRAFVGRTPLELSDSNLEIVQGDAADFDAVSDAVSRASAVASALGPRRGGPPDLLEVTMGTIIHAMAVHSVRKLAAVSAAGTFQRKDPGLPLATRMMIATVLRPTYDDLERMEMRIKASDLDWTIVKPVGLTDGPLTGEYRFAVDGALLAKASTVSRADVAAAVLKALETDLWDRRSVMVAD